jgi:hypothetical protein
MPDVLLVFWLCCTPSRASSLYASMFSTFEQVFLPPSSACVCVMVCLLDGLLRFCYKFVFWFADFVRASGSVGFSFFIGFRL